MTIPELFAAMCAASDAGVDGIGIYAPSLTNATRNKDGLTTLTFKVRVREFTPNDAMTGLAAWLAIGTVPALKKLEQESLSAEPQCEAGVCVCGHCVCDHADENVQPNCSECDCSGFQCEEASPAIPAAERPARDPLVGFCQSEGPRGETICMMPLGHKGRCGWEKLR